MARNADTGSSTENISDIHLHKADSSSSSIFMLPFLPFTFFFPQLLSVFSTPISFLYPLSESISTFCPFPFILGSTPNIRFYISF